MTIYLDLINNSISIKELSSPVEIISLDKFDLDQTYKDQHENILLSEGTQACSYNEGLKVNKFIDEIKSWS